ncbi:MAG: hypothetical protein QOH12_3052 [Solirubrobacteraceae bacterium]|nr:hypothetical protein [Solirubrobacteraceae bacterium]
MLRLSHDSSSPGPRLIRRPPTVRGALALAGSIFLLASLGAGPAQADRGVDLLLAANADTGIGPKINRSATPQATTDATGTTGFTSPSPPAVQPSPTPAATGPLVVTMTASPEVATVGQTVTYTADVSGAPPGKRVLYHWAFEGGTAVGPQIHRTYPDPGEFPVAVTVTVASVAGLGGAADLLTVVVANAKPAKVPGNGGSAGGGQGSGNGRGSGTGNGSSTKPAATRAHAKQHKATAAQGVRTPLPAQAPSPQSAQRVEGFVLSDLGTPFVPPTPTPPTPDPSGPGGSGAGLAGAGGAAGIGGAIALTIAIVTLGALDERRRISLRNA